MKLTLKNYKLTKTKLLIKKNNILIFCYFFNDITKEFLKLKQKMLKKKVKFFKTNSFLTSYLLKNSIYLNLKNLNFGPITILHFSVVKFFNKVISGLATTTNNSKLYFFCGIFNKKFYSLKLFSYLNTLKFVFNINLFYLYLKKFTKVYLLSSLFLLNKKLFRNNVI